VLILGGIYVTVAGQARAREEIQSE
jgi:hypothetical protein